jgi:hypothetical protein
MGMPARPRMVTMKRPEEIARIRGKSVEEVAPKGMLRAYQERNRPARPVVEVP